jgi:hypothetical protein
VSRVKNSYISSFEPAHTYRVRAIHVAVFIVLFTLIFGTMEYVNRTYSVVDNQYYKLLSRFQDERKDVEILFLGDSQFEYGINTDMFGYDTYNLSLGGINFIQSYYLLKHNIAYMPNLKVVALPLDHHSFHSFKSDRFELFFVDKYLDWRELLPIKGPRILIKRFNYFTIMDDTLGRKSLVEKAIAYVFGRKVITFKRAASSGPSKRVPLDKDLVLYFYKTLVLCKAHNVKVVTVSTPLTREYSIGAEKKLYRIDDIERFIFGNSKYGDLIYRNFNHIAWNPDEKALFKDGHHLNHKGRDAFTPILADELNTVTDEISKTDMKSQDREDR